MATYSLQSIDERAFDAFVRKPTKAQIATLVEKMVQLDYYQPPVWQGSEAAWATKHLEAPDWYANLAEEEMQAWENGIRTVVELPEFDLRGHGFHCAVSMEFIDFAARAFAHRGQDAVVRNFFPYRYFGGYHPELEAHERIFNPFHALLSSSSIARLIEEVSDYDSLLRDAFPKSPARAEMFKQQIDDDLQEAIEPLKTMAANGRMWYAVVDC